MSEDVGTQAASTTPVVNGVRSRWARLGGGRPTSSPELDPLLRAVRATHPKADISVIERAYAVAERAHKGQMRKSGDEYITHPLAVAVILAELGMTSSTIAAALLHDTVEDTDYSLEELTEDFGSEVAHLVDGVTKLDKVVYGDDAQAETVRKMVIAMSRDIRVLLIKLADRLHNARTWRYVSQASAQRKATETLAIYAPLAHRLGMNTIKWELEDLSFAVLYPKVYDQIVKMVAERAPAREDYLAEVRSGIQNELKTMKIKATVTGRPKHYYSVYQKMVVRGRDFEQIDDLVAVRVLVESIPECYAVLGAMHALWTPLPGRFKDYIAAPKFNMYESLHTTVRGPDNRPVEIQIRTKQMHRRAEYGVAAHWKYKDTARAGGKATTTRATGSQATDPLQDFSWLRQLLDWQKETSDPQEFLESLTYEMSASEIYVYTPKGDVMALPTGSTPVDFAYAVHTEVGHRTVGAKVNGAIAPLDATLNSGDVIEVVTTKAEHAGPSQDWLKFVKSGRARNKIRQWFTKERREGAIIAGREQIAKVLRKKNQPLQRLMSHDSMTSVAGDLRLPDVESVFAAVGEGNVSADRVVAQLVATLGGEDGATEDLAEATVPRTGRRQATDPGVTVVGANDVLVKIAKCCTPVPGDDILGFVTHGKGVSVHRVDCTNAARLRDNPERIIDVAWAPSASSLFMVNMQVEALDRPGLLNDITKALSEQRVNILSASVQTSRDRVALSRFTFEMADPSHLDSVLRGVNRVPAVLDAYRVTGTIGTDPHRRDN
ncbi:bifunctional (p)ppGpp synthetase/guanosine-3',5'-bis(diphosphate) 3'-pyrophosphohydrolase [Ornithinimicrobium sp. Arc0846-15]|nr:bifunctional (p)ppGpp synthetase/guanosine-3',5'-bis(diphosphate) 3'-pyrophosphohydrolase [Ornithinimicrobium laminariae]